MKILYQFALKNPTSWQEVDSSNWKHLPKRPVPKKGELGGEDNIPGWIRNVNIQGLTTEGYDHVAIEEITIGNDEGVKLTVWNDDPDDAHIEGVEDWVNDPQAIVWTILPLAPDPKLGMAINTRQSCKRYCKGPRYDRLVSDPPQNTTVRPWEEFAPPSEEITRHGVWIENEKHSEHVEKAPQHEWGWHHWVEHLPENEIEIESEIRHNKGQIIKQVQPRRKLEEQRLQGRYKQAEHTITYYQRSADRAIGNITYTNEDALELTTTTAASESFTTNATSGNPVWAFTTPANQPNSADWPSGTFNAQLNCTAASTGVTYGIVKFYRADSTPASIEELGDNLEDFSGTGLKLKTNTSLDFSAGSANDCFGFKINASGDSHGDAITLQLNTTDSYADGPWTTEAPYTDVTSTVWPTLNILGAG